jgi:hypothetical protein
MISRKHGILGLAFVLLLTAFLPENGNAQSPKDTFLLELGLSEAEIALFGSPKDTKKYIKSLKSKEEKKAFLLRRQEYLIANFLYSRPGRSYRWIHDHKNKDVCSEKLLAVHLRKINNQKFDALFSLGSVAANYAIPLVKGDWSGPGRSLIYSTAVSTAYQLRTDHMARNVKRLSRYMDLQNEAKIWSENPDTDSIHQAEDYPILTQLQKDTGASMDALATRVRLLDRLESFCEGKRFPSFKRTRAIIVNSFREEAELRKFEAPSN